jgi:hypothetical protein
MRLDLTRTWADAVAMARANGDALSAIAGMFMLLPSVVSGWILPDPKDPGKGVTLADMLTANYNYMAVHWPVVVLSGLIVAFGSLALLALLLHPTRPTVASALRLALIALPFYMLANLLQTLIVLGGFMLLIVPGVYLAARFLCIAPVAVAEGRHGGFAILKRSFELTRGNGLRIVVMLAVMIVVGMVTTTVLGAIVGIASTSLLSPDLARFANILASSIVETGLAVAVTIVGASIYRQTSAPRPSI